MPEMAAARSGPKTAPAQVAARALEGVESGLNHVLADERARQIYDAVRRDPEQLERTQKGSVGSTKALIPQMPIDMFCWPVP